MKRVLFWIMMFLFLLYPYSDFDWGTHFRYGEQLVKGNLMKTDILSWTMYGVKWANHAWLYDPIVYLGYNKLGIMGLSIIGASVALLTFWLGIKRANLSDWQKMIVGMAFVNMTWGVYWEGLRSQMVGILFLTGFCWALWETKVRRKFRWLLPLLFLLWANMHGTFTLGLLVFGIYLGCEWLVSRWKKEDMGYIKQLIVPFILSIAVTFINPFTYTVYEEIYRHLGSSLLRQIEDWIPMKYTGGDFGVNLFVVYSILVGVGFLVRHRLRDLTKIAIWLFSLYLAIDARRYVAVYAALTLPFAAEMLKDFLGKFETYKIIPIIFTVLTVVGIEYAVDSRIIKYRMWDYGLQQYCDYSSGCSIEAGDYLLANLPKGRGFNFYDYGGYLVGRGIKGVFIDGRMHMWNEDGYSAFEDHEKIYAEGDMELFNKYDFSWAVVPVGSEMDERIYQLDPALGWKEEYYDDRMSVWIKRERDK